MSRSTARSAIRPLISQTTVASSSTSHPSPRHTRQASNSGSASRPGTASWPSKTHLRTSPTMPNPLPALYPKQVVLSDGSTFTAHITAPSPSIIRLTRDVTNNPLWAPATEKRGLGDGAEEGRVGRFRRRFEGLGAVGAGQGGAAKSEKAFEEGDLDWMSEGAVEEHVGGAATKAAPGKGGKKK